jgi:hypothetical protein
VVFLLASTSIGSLLSEFYGICPMRISALAIFLPSWLGLAGLALWDRWRGQGRLWTALLVGLAAGLVAAVAYDLFRLPFVFAHAWHLDGILPALKLFKVFPRFGAMLLGQPVEQPAYSVAAQTLGWLYHFSNGASFGMMFMALVGVPQRRHALWGIGFALALEAGMLASPYPAFFSIPMSAAFLVVTLLAHTVFGATLYGAARAFDRSPPER